MLNTPNYNLNKPEGTDFAKISALNQNADIIDTALKENADNIAMTNQTVGQITELQTTNKSTLVSAINEVFQAGNSVKSDVVTALLSIDPSLPITTESPWTEIEAAILEVQTGVDTSDATATAAQILSDATAYVKGSKVTGTMPNRGAITITPNQSNQAIPNGYHNGSGIVQAVSFDASKVLTGTTIAGKAGTMPNRGSLGTITPGTANKNYSEGYYPTAFTVLGDPDLVAANIIQGKNIFGVNGSAILGTYFQAGNILLLQAPNLGRQRPSLTYIPMTDGIKVNYGGVVRISYEAYRADTAYTTLWYNIFKNGIAVGTERTVVWESGMVTTFTQDIPCQAEDVFDIRCKSTSEDTTPNNRSGSVVNFKLMSNLNELVTLIPKEGLAQ